ncbi:hypothetical protein SARC_10617 [Sphaeroforma arctica JP610]|uniref:Uncharacterized protein n=1 Tax=Sphaeroforma arctica JP610 TaxID=667725 RepID=A0A0L0FKA2_9EUKA|nr:hypothetical protein SARC_10617 [Sphaeroforma arctica JP610]KNC76906.1 hypothetical protein SARC_10617 [Sphaeroforma arctica JP610]|eukprot:XP_014150808.1 hypothetical protein SARC_10617 [Sphaeroforma arctica JP610]
MKTRDDETISKLTTDLTNVMGEKQNAERDVMQHQDQINNLTHQLQQRASIIANDESSAERAMDKMHESIAELGNVKVKLAQAERECEALRTKVASLDDTERAHANEVIEMRTTNDDQKSLIREQQQEIDRLRNKVSQLESDIVQIRLSNDTDTEKEWNIEKAKMDSYQDKLTHIINEREEELAESKNQIVHLENELEIIGNDLGRHDIIQECLSTLDGHNQSIKGARCHL